MGKKENTCDHPARLSRERNGLRCDECGMFWDWENAGPVIFRYITQLEREHYQYFQNIWGALYDLGMTTCDLCGDFYNQKDVEVNRFSSKEDNDACMWICAKCAEKYYRRMQEYDVAEYKHEYKQLIAWMIKLIRKAQKMEKDNRKTTLRPWKVDYLFYRQIKDDVEAKMKAQALRN